MGHDLDLRFGVVISDAPTWTQLRQRATTAETLGYATIVMPDHLRNQLPPLVTLSALAAVTTTIKLGTMTLATTIRDPVMTAREAAMVQYVSEGRFELGLGAGWLHSDFTATGTDRPATYTELIDRFADQLHIITRLLAGDPVHDYHSRFRDISDAYLWPPISTPPRIAIGGGSRRILALAAQHADDVSIMPSLQSGQPGAHLTPDASLEAFQRKSQWVQQIAGPRWPTMNVSTHVFFLHIGSGTADYLHHIATKLPLPPHQLAESPLVLAGDAQRICDTIRARQQLIGLNYTLIKASHMHAFAPVLERLT
jgi:probable F420-dependent oxidoreductase